jgi:hypothetical protein
MQTQWPGLGPTFDLASLDAPAGGGPATWPAEAPFGAAPPPAADGIARSWWTCGSANANAGGALGTLLGGQGSSNGSLFGLVSGLVSALQQLVGAMLGGSVAPNAGGSGPTPGGATPWGGGSMPWGGPSPWGAQAGAPPAWGGPTPPGTPPGWGTGTPPGWGAQAHQGGVPGGPEQRFADVDVSSTGDPHIAEVGTRAGRGANTAVDAHWDSMTAHDDLLHTDQIEGGYRVSTAVTTPDANGVTFNKSASVHANYGADDVTMRRDGSYQIFDDGRAVALGTGESATLSGGERVDVNADGSITVNAANGDATVATTLRSAGSGVDVTTHAHDIRLGGDAIVQAGRAPKAAAAP